MMSYFQPTDQSATNLPNLEVLKPSPPVDWMYAYYTQQVILA